MNTKYDEALGKIKFYKYHPEYLPFIGDNYDRYKILQVGESHYLPDLSEEEKKRFNINYFEENWFNSACKDLYEIRKEKYYHTRDVVGWYIISDTMSKAHNMYNNFRLLTEKALGIKPSQRTNYNYVAFMNLFQMPSIKKGDSIKNLPRNKQDFWGKLCKISYDTLKDVIKIINPNIVIITSKFSADCYNYLAQNDNDKLNNNIIFVSHAGCSHFWDKSDYIIESIRKAVKY